MDFKELEYILVIAQEQTVSKAAERLFISQPALSRALLKVEDRIGTPLFVRKNRRYIPTSAGELYLKMAREILNTRRVFEKQLKELTESRTGVLSMGITPGRGKSLLPLVLPAFRREYPDYELKVQEGNVEELERLLLQGRLDLGFFTMTRDADRVYRDFCYQRISREEIVLCTPREEKYKLLAEPHDRKYPWIDLHLMENENFLLLQDNMRLGQLSKELLNQAGLAPAAMYLSSIDTALALVAEGYGVAFASSFRIERHEMAERLHVFSFGASSVDWDFVAASRIGWQIPKAGRFLIERMKQP